MQHVFSVDCNRLLHIRPQGVGDPPTESGRGDDYRWRLPLDLIWQAVTIWQVKSMWRAKTLWQSEITWKDETYKLGLSDNLKPSDNMRPYDNLKHFDKLLLSESLCFIWQSGSHLEIFGHLKSLEGNQPHSTSLDDRNWCHVPFRRSDLTKHSSWFTHCQGSFPCVAW